jgi:nicotinamide-nucleotide amidase
MKAAILTIGDELLIGQVLNSNVQWISEELANIGVRVITHVTCPDSIPDILRAIDYCKNADVLLVGGGLGPTHDDVTMEAIAQAADVDLVRDEVWIERVRTFFRERGREMSKNNEKQALLPNHCTRIDNDCGTAAGAKVRIGKQLCYIFPGVPHEMQSMFDRVILPELKDEVPGSLLTRTLLTTGIGESALAQKLDPIVQRIQKLDDFMLAFLPSTTGVRLRLMHQSAGVPNTKVFESLFADLMLGCSSYFYGLDDETLEEVIVKTMTRKQKTIATCESCTGGLISHRITQVEGSSKVFKGALVPYQVELKTSELGISGQEIEEFGVVSETVARRMAEATRDRFKTDYAVATTGYLGATGGTEKAPNGSAWIAVSGPNGTTAHFHTFEKNRKRAKDRAAQAALDAVRRALA